MILCGFNKDRMYFARKSVNMESNGFNLMIWIHSNPLLEILHSCDKTVRGENEMHVGSKISFEKNGL